MEWVAELFGQTAEQQLDSETSKFNVGKQSIKRSAGERFFDNFLGRSEEIQKLAKDRYTESLKSTQGYQDLEGLQKTPELTSYMTPGSLRGKANTALEEKARDQRTKNWETNPATQRLIKKENDALIYQKGRDREGDRRFESNRLDALDARRATTALGMAQLDVTRQQEANRMAEENRRYDERRADSKKERMAAIIAGLANLGGAFAI